MTRKLALAAAALALAGCSNPLAETGQADVVLLVAAVNGGRPLASDVAVGANGAAQFDLVDVVLAARSKNIRFNETQYTRAIQITRYEVRFYRSDGRNTEGVDVPYRIAGDVSTAVDIGEPDQNVTLQVEVVRAQAKLEPPLRNLRFNSQTVVFTCFAEITVYGRQIASGDVVKATGVLQIDFADWPDEV